MNLTNTGDAQAVTITVAVPPDPCRVAHTPPAFLDAGASSNTMHVTFTPRTTGFFSGTVVVSYKNVAGLPYTLTIPFTGTGT